MLGLTVLLQGCAGLPAREPPPAPAVIGPGPGRVEVRQGRPGLVIGAPDGAFDTSAALVGRELARLTGWGLVVAAGPSRLAADGRPLATRPAEYQGYVSAAAQGALLLYVEVYGNGHQESTGRIEIATVGLSGEDAWRLKTLLELTRDSRLAAADGVPRLGVRVEAMGPARDPASAAGLPGARTAPGRALYIGLPRAAHTTHRAPYTELLADVLSQWAALLPPASR